MRSPDAVLLVIGLYLLVVKYGPSFMADKQPVKATGLMVIYNFFMVGLSLYMFFEVSAPLSFFILFFYFLLNIHLDVYIMEVHRER